MLSVECSGVTGAKVIIPTYSTEATGLTAAAEIGPIWVLKGPARHCQLTLKLVKAAAACHVPRHGKV
jgi:hypothetical protein